VHFYTSYENLNQKTTFQLIVLPFVAMFKKVLTASVKAKKVRLKPTVVLFNHVYLIKCNFCGLLK